MNGNSDDHFRFKLFVLPHGTQLRESSRRYLSHSGHVPLWTLAYFRCLIAVECYDEAPWLLHQVA
jgi:hypothetical protein